MKQIDWWFYAQFTYGKSLSIHDDDENYTFFNDDKMETQTEEWEKMKNTMVI